MLFEIYCNNNDHHPDNAEAVVNDSLLMTVRGGNWLLASAGQAQSITNDAPVDVGDDGPRERFRLKLRCFECGISQDVRVENLAPILEKLASHGVQRLSLAGLASTLGS